MFGSSLKAPFPQLDALLNGIIPEIAPQKKIDLAIGEPRHAPPDWAAKILYEHIAQGELSRYPPTRGIDLLRQNISQWLRRRFGVQSDAEQHILPVCGTREALFLIAACLAVRERRSGKNRSLIIVPDPGYQCYSAAAIGAQKKPVYLAATKETGFLPDLDAVDEKLWNQVLAFYLCTPANPQGAVAKADYLKRAVALAQHYDFTLITDECYAEIYSGSKPDSLLNASQPTEFKNTIAFHSLSKRSNVPGLRSGFCAGDADIIHAFRMMRELGGVSMPLPTQYASAALWADDAHVQNNRALYREKFDRAASILGHWPNFYRPEGGFFLWLDISDHIDDGVAAAKILWRKAGIRVLPGAYLAQADAGQNYIRIALVANIHDIEIALQRMADILESRHVQ